MEMIFLMVVLCGQNDLSVLWRQPQNDLGVLVGMDDGRKPGQTVPPATPLYRDLCRAGKPLLVLAGVFPAGWRANLERQAADESRTYCEDHHGILPRGLHKLDPNGGSLYYRLSVYLDAVGNQVEWKEYRLPGEQVEWQPAVEVYEGAHYHGSHGSYGAYCVGGS